MQDSRDIYCKENTPFLAKRRRRSSSRSHAHSGQHVDKPDTHYFRGEHEEDPKAAGAPPAAESPAARIAQEYTSSHRRRRRHHTPSSSPSLGSRIIWMLLAAVLLLYLALLATTFVGRLGVRRQKAAPVAEAPALAAETAATSPSAEELGNVIRQSVKLWSRAPDVTRDVQRLMDSGSLDKAIDRLEDELKIIPEMVEWKLLLAQAHTRQQNAEAAVALLEQVLDASPWSAPARQLLGYNLILLKQYPAALMVADWSLNSGDDAIQANQIAATAYLNTDQISQAIPHLRKIVSLDSENAMAQNNLGVAYTKLGDYKRAVEVFNTLLQQNAANATTYYNLAACHARQLQVEKAISTLNRAASVFGMGFVGSWVRSPDFDGVREQALWIDFQKSLGVGTEEAETVPPSMLQVIDPLSSGLGESSMKQEGFMLRKQAP